MPVISKPIKLFVFLSGLFITAILVSELIGGKLFSLEESLGIEKLSFSLFGQHNLSLVLSVGVLPWPIVFILTDVINDYFGFKSVRLITYLSVIFILIAFFLISFASKMQPDLNWWNDSQAKNGVPNMNLAFKAIFGQSMNIIFASIVAFLIGQLTDAFIFKQIKKRSGDKWIWLRATFSTLVSQFIDSIAVTLIAFYFLSTMSFTMAFALACTAYLYKFCVALLSTPFLYATHYCIKKYLGNELAKQMRTNENQNN